MLCFPSPFSSKGGSHASFVDRGLTTGIPTGCSRPPYLDRSSYRSLSPIAGWKGSASEPYVKLPPHTAPPRIGDIGSVRRSDMAGSACVGSFRLLHAPHSPRDTRERFFLFIIKDCQGNESSTSKTLCTVTGSKALFDDSLIPTPHTYTQ